MRPSSTVPCLSSKHFSPVQNRILGRDLLTNPVAVAIHLCFWRSVGLRQRHLVMQVLTAASHDKPFSFELGVTDIGGTMRRLVLSSSFRALHCTPLHAQVRVLKLFAIPCTVQTPGVGMELMLTYCLDCALCLRTALGE